MLSHDEANLLRITILFPSLVLLLPLLTLMSGAVSLGVDWRTASRDSAGIAPDPAKTREAVIQVYAARALNWRGLFGVHTWIATKPEDAQHFTVHHVIGWRLWRGLSVVVSETAIPDRAWFGNPPEIIADLRGPQAARGIPEILDAVRSYPYGGEYRLWPGPNSNTFTAYVGRRVPELKLQLPATAIGKDYPINGSLLERSPSGTGYQISLYGLFGVLVAAEEGLEINLLGLSFGVDLFRPALKLPFVGRFGVKNHFYPTAAEQES
ncbi:MAG: DUF3750 domain-containing protein [Deltaproteobacteria bacterium]|nr:DUF3750 domain-containing protein [Deltaproteobacteria bacterium]